jgi:signal transduction histidine kinase
MLPVLRRYLAFTTGVGIAVALAQAALIALVVVGYRRAVERRIGDVSLAVQATILEDELGAGRSFPEIEARLRQRFSSVAQDDEMAIYDHEGRLLARTGTPSGYTPDRLPPELRERFSAGVTPLTDQPLGTIVVGTAREIGGRELYLLRANTSFRNAMPNLVHLGVGALAIPVLLLGILGALAITRMTERQLSKVDRTLRQMAGGDLSARLSLPVDEETAAVVLSFNRMAEQVEQTIAKLRASDESRRQLLADVTHELNTPLTSVLGYLETLCMEGMPLTEEKRRSLTRIAYEEAQNLHALIDDLTTLSRLDAEGLPLERQEIDLVEVVERVVRRLTPMAEGRGVALRVELPGRVGMLGDAQRLDQVVRNLVENALRHTDPPGDVTVSVRADGGLALVEVADRGKGISPEDLGRIGQRFLRTDRSRARHTGGRGLGLPIAIGLVEAHGGKVAFESALGRGTTVRVTLPQGAGASAPAARPRSTTGRLARALLQATAAARSHAVSSLGGRQPPRALGATPVRPVTDTDRFILPEARSHLRPGVGEETPPYGTIAPRTNKPTDPPTTPPTTPPHGTRNS